MSNLTDFFPTGDGVPVNDYASFRTLATGDPVGYNESTGLYTQSNGSVYLKTGKTIAITENPRTYPDATSGSSTWVYNASNNFTFAFDTQAGVAFDGTYYYIPSYNFSSVVQYNTSFVATGTTFTPGTTLPSNFMSLIWEPTSSKFMTLDSNSQIKTWNADFSGPIFTRTLYAVYQSSAQCLAIGPTGQVMASYRGDGNLGFAWYLQKYNVAATGQLVSENGRIELAPNNNTPRGQGLLYSAPNVYFIYQGNALLKNYETGTDVSGNDINITPSNTNRRNMIKKPNGDIFISNYSDTTAYYYDSVLPNVGDSVAKTSTDTLQPLFIKLK